MAVFSNPYVILATLALIVLCLLITGTRNWGYTRGAALTMFAAAFALTVVTLTKLWPALTDTEASRLRTELGVTRTSLADVTRTRDTLATDLKVSREQTARADAAHRASLDRIASYVGDVHTHVRDRATDILIDAPRRAPVERSAQTETRLEAILAEVQDLRDVRARPVPQTRPQPAPAPAREDATREMLRLRDRMTTGIKTDHYEVEPYPARELVGGRTGRYYIVDMKDASSGIRYYFEGGRYVLRTGNAEFRSSLNKFIQDVLSKVEGNARYELFVRGSADAKPFEGRMEPGYEYQQVSFLRLQGPDRYTSQPGEMVLQRGVVRNVDLPNLRAAFMRDLVASTYPIKTPQILEGSVTPKANDRDRNVELILFVDW